jgi:hypothetical protein
MGLKQSDKKKNMYRILVQERNARLTMMSAVAAMILAAPGIAGNAFAAQIDASLIPEYDRAIGSFTGTKFIQINYEPGSSASSLFNGANVRVEFSVKGSNATGMSELVSRLNSALADVQSPARVTGANLTYAGVLKGEANRLTLSYRVEVVQTFTGFKLNQTAQDDIPVDINWRGFVVEGPVVVDSPDHGPVNVNQPAGLLELAFPDFAHALMETEAGSIMSEPILDFREIGEMKMEKWHWLFDPTIRLPAGAALLGIDIGSAKVLSVYSMGECSIREGCPLPKERDVNVTVDGAAIKVHGSTPQPNSQIEIAGFTSIEQAGQHQILRVRMDNPNPSIPPFTLQVLLVLGGMMGAIAIAVLFKTRK